jgi:ribosomal protein S18 acetylase RimI-like enzyme
MAARVTLMPMDESDFAVFVEHAVPAYAADKVRNGNWSRDEATRRAAQEFLAFLPQGLATSGQHLYVVRDAESGATVGSLWLGDLPGSRRAGFVYDIKVDETLRGRGYGEATMRAAEEESRRLGHAELKLHVFADNVAARALYVKLGYSVTNLNMSKPLV